MKIFWCYLILICSFSFVSPHDQQEQAANQIMIQRDKHTALPSEEESEARSGLEVEVGPAAESFILPSPSDQTHLPAP
jgi:hypothetical protein